MTPRLRRLGRAVMVLAGLALGIGLAVLFVANRQAPERQEATTSATPVRIVEARPLDFRLEARGHGVARPTETWQAVANVAGRVVERHPGLDSGTLLREGTLLVALDPSRYELAIAEAEAELATLAAEQTLLETEEENTRRLLTLERERLGLTEQELARLERLAARNAVSRSQLDEQRRATLAQRQAVASLENQLALVPARGQSHRAQVERASTRLAQARRDLEDTRFVAPYDLRLGEVEVEMHQFVGAGQRLFQADNLAAAEVEAHVPFAQMRRLLGVVSFPELPEGALDLGERLDFSEIRAEVELVGTGDVAWTGRVVRVASGLDPATRTARVVVQVDHPYRDARPPDRPPLLRDMYTRVTLWAADATPRLVVPAAAVHRGEVYLANGDDRLERRPVEVAFEQHDLTVIAAGLAPRERVIVDDLQPAIAGMALAPRYDDALAQRLRALAAGERP
ncbi:efflux RND transporter periplasmic adaptor subunit [Halomonas sp. LBP4]|uniref:efflux RND transporter periplasmic adaptor subunit n=1 Tax=Halomonas sp. LBP4 TaxID=2044917 RepID=UPI000D75D959|nr:HlyD family efflux transporter periplasmic adaptor subunit [Halomonas sp. LBP4]PXX96392.1 efflux transporter periplasmic adaptor subunit [Halomonas sp. LBP4]